ncbi:MAG: hypothetical protein ACI9CB_002474 [Rhodothermales bacterium]|jgi:hypothetical protein
MFNARLLNRYICLIVIVLIQPLSFTAASASQLEPRFYPPGTSNLVAYYDPHLDITVTADLNMSFTVPLGPSVTLRNYENAVHYINSLNFTDSQPAYLDVNTWRLPWASRNDPGCDLLPAQGIGYFCNGSEMGHIFYDDFNGQKLQGLPGTWPFKMTVYNFYWSAKGSDPHYDGEILRKTRLSFDMSNGFQAPYPEFQGGAVWPVTDGDPLARPAIKIAGVVMFSPTDVNTTSSHVQRFEVSNIGDAPLTILAINQSNPTEFPLVVDHCSGKTIVPFTGNNNDPAEYCDVAYSFHPTRDGGRSDTIQIESDAFSSPDTITAAGTGVGVAVEAVSPSELHFGLIPVHQADPASISASFKTFALTNTGTSKFNVQSVISDQTEFVVSYDSCSGKDIYPPLDDFGLKTCEVEVKFHPTAAGALSGHIEITTDSATSPPVAVAMTGTGTVPNLVLSSYIQDFSRQALNTISTIHTITVSNTGNETLHFLNLSLTDIGIRSDSSEFQIIDNQCGLSLAVAASCTFGVIFEPVSQGPRSGTIHIAGYDPTVLLSGYGEAVALELLIPNDLHFGEQAVGSSSAAQSVGLVNLGSADISVASIIPDNSDFVVETDSCSGQIVVPNAGCGFSIRFNPSVSGAQSGHVVVNSDAPSSPDNVAVTGTGTVPKVTLSPDHMMFEPQAVGTNALPQTLVITNTGKADLVISALNSTLPDFTLISENCVGKTLASGSTCQILVGFIPGRDGGISSAIEINSNASTSPDNVIVSGTGIGSAAELLSPTELHFGPQPLGTPTAPSVVTVTNSGSANLNIASLSSDNTEYVIVSDECTGQSIAPSGTCQFSVQFNASFLGIQIGHITITSDASTSPDHVALTGTGIAPSVLLSSTNINFGPLPVGVPSTPQTISATNTSSAPLSISSIDSDNAEFSFSADTCSSQTLAAGAQCTFDVNFTATSDGAQSALLQFISNAGTSPDKISVTGSGLRVSAESLSPPFLDFLSVIIGHPAITKQVLLTNIGSTDIVATSVSVASPHYSVVDDLCSGITIAQQSHCTFGVRFSPTAVGTWNSQVEVQTNISDSPDLLSVTGTGAKLLLPTDSAIPVPTTSQWALIVLSMLFGLMVFANRKRLF